MKTFLCLGVVAVAFASSAQADLLVEYNLNNAVVFPAVLPFFGADQNAAAVPTGGTPANATSFIGFEGKTSGNTSLVAGAGGGAGNFAVRFNSVTNNPLASFSLNSTGYESLILSFDYDSGGPTTSFLTLNVSGGGAIPLLGFNPTGGFHNYTIALPSYVNNQASTIFTIASLNNGAGFFVFDNISVSGAAIGLAPIPEPTEIALPLFGLLVGGIWLYRRQKGTTSSAATAV